LGTKINIAGELKMKRPFAEVLTVFMTGGVTSVIIASLFTNDPQIACLAFVGGGAGLDVLYKYAKSKES